MNNIYDTAHQLDKDFRELPAYQNLKEAFEEIAADETATRLFNEFKEASQSFQAKQMQGIQPEEDEIQALQDLSQKVLDNGPISKLMDSEQQINQILADINQIVTKPLQELYEDNEIEKQADAQEDAAEEE